MHEGVLSVVKCSGARTSLFTVQTDRMSSDLPLPDAMHNEIDDLVLLLKFE